jgi:hypothetical protein
MNKCQKYVTKLSNTSVNDPKFGTYLTKLNYWHKQSGGIKPTTSSQIQSDEIQNQECNKFATRIQTMIGQGTNAKIPAVKIVSDIIVVLKNAINKQCSILKVIGQISFIPDEISEVLKKNAEFIQLINDAKK